MINLNKPVNLVKRTTPNADTAVRSGLAPVGRIRLGRYQAVTA